MSGILLLIDRAIRRNWVMLEGALKTRDWKTRE